jgi:hypothetical protein
MGVYSIPARRKRMLAQRASFWGTAGKVALGKDDTSKVVSEYTLIFKGRVGLTAQIR